MPPRNVQFLIVAIAVAILCNVTASRFRRVTLLGDAIALIDRFYIDPVDETELVESAMDGLTAQLDQHSEFIPARSFGMFNEVMDQEFAGVGILVEQPDPQGPIRIITPLVGSPALEAGLLPGDEIIGVAGQDVSTADMREVTGLLRGPLKTEVMVRVRRELPQGDTLVEARLQRRNILIESVVGDYRDGDNRWVYRLKDHPEIAYLRVSSFGEKTATEIRGAIEGLGEGVTGLILDVRGNAGGLLNAAVEVCDDFLEEGRIVTIKRRGGEIDTEFEAIPGAIVPMGLPMVVLIDGDSASASEVVAACLQDHGRAKLVGVRSFGKGTVQNVLPLQGGRSALKLTTARYYRPNGQNIHRLDAAPDDDLWGVRPDEGFEVPMSSGARRRLDESWQIRSFPVALQETILRQQASKANSGKDDVADAKAAGRQRNRNEDDREGSPGDGDNSEPTEQGAGDQESGGPVVDPVLNRAVDHLKSLRSQADPNESQPKGSEKNDAEPNAGAAKRAA